MDKVKEFGRINIFFAYAREDKELRDRLDKHLSTLKRQDYINTWYDGEISAGSDWEKEINKELAKADVILLLVSVDFIASDYCYEVEMEKALIKHEKGNAIIIPVILKHCDWKETPFSVLQALPDDGIAVVDKSWGDREVALRNVAQGIKVRVKDLMETRAKELKSITEVLDEKQNELKIALNRLEESQIAQEILIEEMDKQKKEKAKQELIIKSLTERGEKFKKLISEQQVEINRFRGEIQKAKSEKTKLESSIQKLEKKKENIENEIKKIKKKPVENKG